MTGTVAASAAAGAPGAGSTLMSALRKTPSPYSRICVSETAGWPAGSPGLSVMARLAAEGLVASSPLRATASTTDTGPSVTRKVIATRPSGSLFEADRIAAERNPLSR